MPSPSPMSSQCSRSAGVPCRSRGYQSMGTESSRPSVSSTRTRSSVTRTWRANAVGPASVREVLMPPLEQLVPMLLNESRDLQHLVRSEAAVPRYLHERQPDLRPLSAAPHVYVRRLPAVGGVEEQPIRAEAKDGRHAA